MALPPVVRGVFGAIFFTYVMLNSLVAVAVILAAFIALRPVSVKTFLKVGCWIQGSFIVQFVFWMEYVLGIELRVTGEMPRTEAALVIPNHQGHDWVHMYCMAFRIGTLGFVRTVIKKVISMVPGLGWAMYLTYWPFVSRDFKKDEILLKSLFGAYHEASLPVQLWLYAEGTRLTPKKLADSQAYAKAQGYPAFEHVMLPRHRGFAVAANSLVGVVEVIHELTLAYEGWEGAPSLWQLLCTDGGKKNVFHMNCQRSAMALIPADDEGKKQWLMDCFQRKEDKLAYYSKNGAFPGKKLNGDLALMEMLPHLLFWAAVFAAALKIIF
jgi:lysophosphatidic acid acyltransferase/lysophosphatidylinositol acyltransferase